MTNQDTYRLLADTVLVIHFAFVAFVIIGLLITWIGYFRRWSFVRNFYFRAIHILSMGVVLLESVFDIVCPLTDWEIQLRTLGEQTVYGEQTFMQYWIHKIMFFNLGTTTFIIIYAGFFTALVLSFIFVRPGLPGWLSGKRAAPGKNIETDAAPDNPETDHDPRHS